MKVASAGMICCWRTKCLQLLVKNQGSIYNMNTGGLLGLAKSLTPGFSFTNVAKPKSSFSVGRKRSVFGIWKYSLAADASLTEEETVFRTFPRQKSWLLR